MRMTRFDRVLDWLLALVLLGFLVWFFGWHESVLIDAFRRATP